MDKSRVMPVMTREVKPALQPCRTTFKVTVFRSRKTKQVLFLEADKDFVDTLLTFLVLPMGTILNILSQGLQKNSLGGISCIFESLDSTFLHLDKDHLVKSRPAVVGCNCEPSTRMRFEQDLVVAQMMHCSQHDVLPYSTDYINNCKVDGFVKHNMKFIVTDKLEIIPSSVNTSMILLEKLDLTSVKDTESNEMTVNITQIVELLHSALISKKCLNDVF